MNVESLLRLKTFLTKTFTHDRLTTVTSKLVTMKRHVTLALFVQRERDTHLLLWMMIILYDESKWTEIHMDTRWYHTGTRVIYQFNCGYW